MALFRKWISGRDHVELFFATSVTFITRRCTEAIQFVQCGRYINPSRVSPLYVNAKRMAMKGSRFRLNVDTHFAICVTCICVTDSYLYRLPSAGIPQRQVRGIVHSQEWERLVAFFCMVFDEKDLHAQLFQDALTFSTKPQSDGRVGPSQGFLKSASPAALQPSFKDPFVKDFGDEGMIFVCFSRRHYFRSFSTCLRWS